MKIYPIPMVPGPVKVAQQVLDAYQINYGSADLEAEFLELYNRTEANLKTIMATQNQVVIQTGEGMLALVERLEKLPGSRRSGAVHCHRRVWRRHRRHGRLYRRRSSQNQSAV